MQIVEDSRSPLKKLRPKFKPIYMMLFNDLLLLTKKKRYFIPSLVRFLSFGVIAFVW